ncbi:hypothetical protein CTAM01_16990 [Colletotrichum tamarilloi]|uniref:Uncharacterized protein n=1 Tax=Colletotrichum tamarilloi TaxID=1209934 RepID=A0ABQ9QHA5_9PEZI|nr:uncharacterized protein CTAM01_16990 [Colletotrichum tamarilloi]KAK1467813.1 hypothetical protein CTAM01_16990 [Colletotrichum tamarilloi]
MARYLIRVVVPGLPRRPRSQMVQAPLESTPPASPTTACRLSLLGHRGHRSLWSDCAYSNRLPMTYYSSLGDLGSR